MYYCYLRAKRNELLAIRDCAEKIKSANISIILEPVRNNPQELVTCFNSILDSNNSKKLIYILNPIVGHLSNNHFDIIEQANKIIKQFSNITLGIIVDQRTDYSQVEYWMKLFSENNFSLIHFGEMPDYNDTINRINDTPRIISNIFYHGRVSDNYINLFTAHKILLEDCFNRLNRNYDYQHNIVEFFSDRHLNYQTYGFQGFANFSTIGDYYAEGGSQPYTTAFHLTFNSTTNSVINIQHCLSAPRTYREPISILNEELLEDIYNMINQNPSLLTWSSACTELVQYYKSNNYSYSLGTLKRLSVRHHFELMAYLKDIGTY